MKSFPFSKIFRALLPLVALTSCQDDFGNPGGRNEYAGREMVFSALPEMTEDTRGSLADRTARASSTLVLRGTAPGDSIFCSVAEGEIASAPITRGSYNTGQRDFSDMGVSAVMRKTSNNEKSYYFKNVIYSRTGETDAGNMLDLWQCEDIHYWWGKEENYTFYAVAPWNAQTFGLTVNTEDVEPTLSYTVPSKPVEQMDLLAVKTPEYPGDHNKNVPLNFRHLLSAIEVRQGTGMRPGTIKSVTFKNIRGSGTYSFNTGWTPAAQTADYSLTGNFPASDNASVTGDKNIMFLLPQDLTGAEVEVTLDYNGNTKVYTTPLSGSWAMGSTYTYTITIHPEFRFDATSEVIDAHYEKFAVTVTPDAVADGISWTLSSGLSGVTFLSDADYTGSAQYALLRQGFWTDRMFDGNNGNRDIGSARGESTITFTGNTPQKVWVFVPENIGTADREIPLRATAGSTASTVYNKVKQYAAFGPNDGWEQTADSPNGSFGFCWDLKVSYQLVYSGDSEFRPEGREAYCNNLINANNASGYAITQSFRYDPPNWWETTKTRYCITLNYAELSNLDIALSRSEGLANTKALYNFGKGASTASFETVLQNTYKTEAGKENEIAFRKMTERDLASGTWSNYANNGTPVTGSDAVGSILKKNKYNVIKTVVGEDNVASYSASLSDADIVWYLPAVDEFSNAPSSVVQSINKSGWSSTAVAGATNSYLGNGSSTNRKTSAAIRARRTRQ